MSVSKAYVMILLGLADGLAGPQLDILRRKPTMGQE